jgi:hypothetical protein
LQRHIHSPELSKKTSTIRKTIRNNNTKAEIDSLVEMLKKIAAGDYNRTYVLNKEKGEYSPREFKLEFEQYFKL